MKRYFIHFFTHVTYETKILLNVSFAILQLIDLHIIRKVDFLANRFYRSMYSVVVKKAVFCDIQFLTD